MPLVLTTEVNPGTASWLDAQSVLSAAEVVETFGLAASPTSISGTTKGTGTATVTTAPLAAGDTLVINNKTLTGVAGARTPGNNDFNTTGGTVDAVARAIIEALNDPNNQFQNDIVASTTVAGRVDLEARDGGTTGNYTLSSVTVPPGGITLSGAAMTGGGTTQSTVVTFPAASSNMLLKQLFVAASADQQLAVGPFALLTSITVGGGANLISGITPLTVVDATSPATSPELNIPVSTGQVVTLTFQGLLGKPIFVVPTWTKIDLPTSLPSQRSLLGCTASVASAGLVSASTNLTVTSAANTLAGDSIILIDNAGNALALTGTGGARTAGQNDFDTTGAIGAIVASIVAAINDAGNDFVGAGYSAVDNNPIVTISYSEGGSLANVTASVEVKSSGITPATASYTGGVNASGTLTFPAAPQDIYLERLYVDAILGQGTIVSSNFTITAVQIDGGANLIEGIEASALLDGARGQASPLLDIAVSAGEVVTVTFGANNAGLVALASWVTRPQ